MTFAQIRDKEKEAVNVFGVSKYPTIVVLPGGDQDGIVYDGKVQKDDLFKFFSTIAPPTKEPEPSAKPAKKTPKKEKASKKEKKPKKTEEQKPIVEEVKTEPEVTEEEKIPERMITLTLKYPSKLTKRIAKPLVPELADQAALTEACLSPKSKTCILAIAPAEPISETIQNIYETLSSRTVNAFNVYKLAATSAHAEDLVAKLDLAKDTATKFVAVNAKRNWVRKFVGNADSEEEVLAWLDAVRLGDGKKEKLPAGLVAEEEEEEHDEL